MELQDVGEKNYVRKKKNNNIGVSKSLFFFVLFVLVCSKSDAYHALDVFAVAFTIMGFAIFFAQFRF